MDFEPESTCKHDKGFALLTTTSADRPPYAWYCRCSCGYYLNFDPENVRREFRYGAPQDREHVVSGDEHGRVVTMPNDGVAYVRPTDHPGMVKVINGYTGH